MRKLQGTGWVAGHEDAQILAIRGEKDRALDALEAAVDAGTRPETSIRVS